MMENWGLKPTDTDKIYPIGAGGYVRMSDMEAYVYMTVRHQKELREARKSDVTGGGFIYDMFYTELCDHEYCVTRNHEETLEALGISMEKIESDPALSNGFALAILDAQNSDGK